MDTFKDKQRFDELNARGKPPWEVWELSGARSVEERPTTGAPVDGMDGIVGAFRGPAGSGRPSVVGRGHR